jgi:hypothetical protein
MSDDRRRRFQQIERPRAPGETPPDASPATDARFEAVVHPDGPAAPRHSGAPDGDGSQATRSARPAPEVASGHVDRFRPAAEPVLQVDDLGEASQPFIRCCRCETDCSRYVARCTTCGASLDTDEQRAFNQRLWAARRATAAAEDEAAAAHRAVLDAAAAEEALARRAMGEAMAREVGDRERARLDATDGAGFGWPGGGGWASGGNGGLGGDWSGGDAWTPPGIRLLRLIPDPRWRVAAGVGAVALAALLFLAKPAAGLSAAAVLIGLLVPSGRWRSWRRF